MKTNENNYMNDHTYKTVKDTLLQEEISLPESLSEENIKKLLDEQVPLRTVKGGNKKRRLVALVASAAVLCLCVVGFLAVRTQFPSSELGTPLAEDPSAVTIPETLLEVDFMTEAIAYDDIMTLVKAYADKSSYTYVATDDGGVLGIIGGWFGADEDAEVVVNEDMAVADTSFATQDSASDDKYYTYNESAPEAPESDAAAGTTTAGSAKPDYGKTNVQIEGVDEADILKNDGENLYLLKGNIVHVFRAYPADSMKELSYIVLKDQFDEEAISYYYANEMFLYNNYLCVMLTCYYNDYENSRTMAMVYDISDPANPVFVQRYAQDGGYLSSRIADGKLITVTTHGGFYTYEYTSDGHTCVVAEDRVIPKTYIGSQEGMNVPETDMSIADSTTPTAFTVATLINMDDLTQPIRSEAVLGGGTDVFCTNENLFVARRVYDVKEYPSADGMTVSASSYVSTQIFSFTFADGDITRLATGTVPGEPLNQFSMDEYNGYFRIAVTFGSDNGLYVLDSNLVIVGDCAHYGADERIQSVRFMGDWAYVVTFRQTDPLYVINLTDPVNPVIAGEVKLPGFSAYLHPIGNGLVLGLGYGGTESGLDGSAKISLFDVSDPTNPVELDALVHEKANLSTEHKAFCTVSDGSFLIPMFSFTITTDAYGYEVWQENFGSVLHFAVENNKLVVRNEYACTGLYTSPNRTTYIDSVVYAVSPYYGTCIYAFDMSSGELLGTASSSDVYVSYQTSGWTHYVQTEESNKVYTQPQPSVVMTTPAYNPQAETAVDDTVVYTTAAPQTEAEEDIAIAYTYDYGVEYAVSDPTKP